MTRWLWVLAWIPVAAAAAPRAPGPARGEARATVELAAFERELDKVFTTDGLTAEAAARRASKAAPIVARKTASVEAAEADRARSKLSLAPILGGKATYTRLSPVDPVVLPLGPQNFVIPFLENSYSVTGQLTFNVSDYVSRDPSLIEGARQAHQAARHDKSATAAMVAQQARELYYEWLRAKLQVLVAKRQLAQVETTRAQIKSLVDVQRASTADLLRVESQRAQAEQGVDRFASAVVLREEQLRLLIGAADGEVLTVGEDVREAVDVPELAELDQLAARATSRRDEIKALDSGIQAKEAQKRAEGSALVPRLSAFASVDYARPNQRLFPQKDEFALTWVAGVQASWIINESLVANQQRNRLAAEAQELMADRTNARQQIRLEVLRAVQAVTLAERAIKTSQQGVEAAEEGYRVRKDLLAANRASVVEMVDAETELTRARIAALDARIDLRIALARLAYATGEHRTTF